LRFIGVGSMLKVYAVFLIVMLAGQVLAQEKKPAFRVLALSESGGHHIAYSKAAKLWLNKLAETEKFAIDYIEDTDRINEKFLARYQLFIQLDFVPYGWKPEAVRAFEKYIKDFTTPRCWASLTDLQSGPDFLNLWVAFVTKTIFPHLRQLPLKPKTGNTL
jgi:hypothetical protein